MARNKTYDTDDVILAIDNYFNFICRGDVNKLIMTKICNYLNDNGFPDVNDRKLNRDPLVREHIIKLKDTERDDELNELITYKTLDVEDFLKTNSSIEKLRKALVIRDNYYSNVSRIAINKIEDANHSMNELNEKLLELEKIKEENAQLKSKLTEKNKAAKNLELENAKYKSYIDKTMLPELANQILRNEHILVGGELMVNETAIADMVIQDDSSINEVFDNIKRQESKFKNNLISGLFDSIKED